MRTQIGRDENTPRHATPRRAIFTPYAPPRKHKYLFQHTTPCRYYILIGFIPSPDAAGYFRARFEDDTKGQVERNSSFHSEIGDGHFFNCLLPSARR